MIKNVMPQEHAGKYKGNKMINKSHQKLWIPTLLIVMIGLLSACAPKAPAPTVTPTSNGATKVQVVENNYAILLSKSVVSAGLVEFDLSNEASISHTFLVFKTDLAADNLPLASDGTVNKDSPMLDLVAQQLGYPAGETRTLNANLDAGHYAVICNLKDGESHYQMGMRIDFTVVPAGQKLLPQPVAPVTPAGNPTKVQIIEKANAIMSNRSAVPTGQIEFDLSNQADIPLEFVIFKTDLPADSLPLNSDGTVNENSPLLNRVAAQDQYPAGETRTLTANLDPGHYALICNLSGDGNDYRNGMYFDFTVSGSGS